jgi:hypothetical protein
LLYNALDFTLSFFSALKDNLKKTVVLFLETPSQYSKKLFICFVKANMATPNNISRLASLKNVQPWIITDIQKDAVKVFTDLLRSYAL